MCLRYILQCDEWEVKFKVREAQRLLFLTSLPQLNTTTLFLVCVSIQEVYIQYLATHMNPYKGSFVVPSSVEQ